MRAMQVRVERGKDLPSVSAARSTMVQVRHGEVEHSTAPAKKSLHPEWQNTFRFARCAGEPVRFVLCRKSKGWQRFRVLSSASLNLPELVRCQCSLTAFGLELGTWYDFLGFHYRLWSTSSYTLANES